MDPVILPSARKHGIPDDDILHAYRNPVRVLMTDDLDTMIVGPAKSVELLELGLATSDGIDFIFHAMPARPKFLE